MKKVRLALAGAGERGLRVYGDYVRRNPHLAKFVAVAEPDSKKRDNFGDIHGIPSENRFSTWEEMLDKPMLADAMLVCTQDRQHYLPAVKGLEVGYHILLEKPMSVHPAECVKMGRLAQHYNRALVICHVLRYTPFFSKIKEIIASGIIGRIMSIQLNENIAFWHIAHSYVRGNWRNSEDASPMVLAKSCHDMDILSWLAGSECVKLSSFGRLSFFKKENAPDGAAERCLNGCKLERECTFSAVKQYLGSYTGWPVSAVSFDTSFEARVKALQEGPYGRCVFHCDNNVVDHQVVSMEFENEVTAVFSMTGFTHDNNRALRIMGTAGDIRASMNENEIIVYNFAGGIENKICLPKMEGGHGGGDEGLFSSFIQHVSEGVTEASLTSAHISVQSHLMAFAAEEARLENRIVNMKEFEQRHCPPPLGRGLPIEKAVSGGSQSPTDVVQTPRLDLAHEV